MIPTPEQFHPPFVLNCGTSITGNESYAINWKQPKKLKLKWHQFQGRKIPGKKKKQKKNERKKFLSYGGSGYLCITGRNYWISPMNSYFHFQPAYQIQWISSLVLQNDLEKKKQMLVAKLTRRGQTNFWFNWRLVF